MRFWSQNLAFAIWYGSGIARNPSPETGSKGLIVSHIRTTLHGFDSGRDHTVGTHNLLGHCGSLGASKGMSELLCGVPTGAKGGWHTQFRGSGLSTDALHNFLGPVRFTDIGTWILLLSAWLDSKWFSSVPPTKQSFTFPHHFRPLFFSPCQSNSTKPVGL